MYSTCKYITELPFLVMMLLLLLSSCLCLKVRSGNLLKELKDLISESEKHIKSCPVSFQQINTYSSLSLSLSLSLSVILTVNLVLFPFPFRSVKGKVLSASFVRMRRILFSHFS